MPSLPIHPSPTPPAGPATAPDARPLRVALLVRVAGPETALGSPCHATLPHHAAALAGVLPMGWRVRAAVLHGEPSIADAIRAATADGATELVVVPLSPHFSDATSGAITRELYRLLGHVEQPINVGIRASWHDDAGYVNAQASLIAKHAAARGLHPPHTHLLFWADDLPGSPQCGGGPWKRQVERTVELVTERLGWPAAQVSLACQEPSAPGGLASVLPPRLDELRRAGVGNVLLCPITVPATVPRVLERLVDEDHALPLEVCPQLDAQDQFVSVLRDLVLRGSRPVTAPCSAPLLAPTAPVDQVGAGERSLMMIGASLANGIHAMHGPSVRHSSAPAFARVRKSRKALHAFLQWTREQGLVAEAFVWDTCQRIEFYGWLDEIDDVAARECVAARIRHQLYGCEPQGLEVNILFGDAARHHLLRTACGLNSALPGDTDVVAQLQTALRIANCSGAAGTRAAELVRQAAELAEEVRAETPWGRFSTGYCLAALSHLRDRGGMLDDRRHVVIGGSTTSRSILSVLTEQFHVPQRQLTLVYREHHGQMKLLRSAIGHGRRLRVHAYAEPGVVQAIGDADFVFFGIDQSEPVLDPGTLRGLRDFVARPLTIVDFNSFGSLGGAALPDGVTVWAAEDLERAVALYAEGLYAHGEFAPAVAAAEEWIEHRLAPAGAVA
jgi:glutamyl-tRNA reductase/protoheme ferro-lyase